MEFSQILSELRPFMYCATEGGASATKTICGDAPKAASPQKPAPEPAPALAPVITPVQPDTLAWCCYILLHGRGAYETLVSVASASFSNADELNLRRALVDEIAKDPKKVKSHCNHKITKVALEEIKSNLLTGVKLKIPELIAFCVYYNKSVIVIFGDNPLVERGVRGDEALAPRPPNKCYTTINSGVDDAADADAIIYYNSRSKKYSIGAGAPAPDLSKMIAIEQYNKIMRGFSAYKTAELEEMYKMFCESGETLSKKEMYEFVYKTLHACVPQ